MNDHAVIPVAMLANGVTLQMLRVYGVIQAHAVGNESSPTLEEIALGTGMDVARACAAVTRLVNGGWLVRRKDGKRNVYQLTGGKK